MICTLMIWWLGEKACKNKENWEVEKIKSDSIELFEKGGFKLHKWHSNEPNIETIDLNSEKELNFAKEHRQTKANET